MSNIISSDEVDSCSSWSVPTIENEQLRTSAAYEKKTVTAKQYEDIEKQAYDEGFARGKADGVKAGMGEAQLKAENISNILSVLSEPFELLNDEIEDQLVSLSIAIAKQIVRREIKIDSGQIVAVVREALESLPLESQKVRVYLHASDAEIVKNALSLTEDGPSYVVCEDPTVSPGGCRVVSDTSQIDASLDARIATIAANILGSEREKSS